MASGKQRRRVFNLIFWKQRNGITRCISCRVMHAYFFKYAHTNAVCETFFAGENVIFIWSVGRGQH